MNKKKGRIRYDRIIILVLALVAIIYLISLGIKTLKKIDKKEEKTLGDNVISGQVKEEHVERLIPKALSPGSTIGIISPAGPSEKEAIDRGVEVLEGMGYKVKLGKYAYDNIGYLASTDANRAEDLNNMFKDKEVDGIICIRGGYGTPRLLHLVDYEAIKANPKVLVGYSDITSLYTAINQKTGLVVFHGPMVRSEIQDSFNGPTLEYFNTIIANENMGKIIKNPPEIESKSFVDGQVEGDLVGGNLRVLLSSIGTEYEIDTKGKILFIEDTNESIGSFDRMLNQLKLSGKIDDSLGIILGDFNNMDPKSVEDVARIYFEGLDKPVLYNIKSGHSKPMITLPIGVRVQLDSKKGEIKILESAVK